MKAALEFWEKLVKQVSETFLLRAVLPWACGVLINLGLHEFVTPDGRSLISSFLLLSEDHPTLVSMSLAAWTYVAALVSDGFASHLISKYRGEAAARIYLPSDDQLPFEIRSWWDETNVPSLSEDDRRKAISAKIEETFAATLREANSAAALFVSTWAIAISFPSQLSGREFILAIVGLLTVLAAGLSVLAWRNLENLIALDGIRRGSGDASLTESQTLGASGGQVHSFWRLQTALLLLLPCLFVLGSYIASNLDRPRSGRAEDTKKDDTEHLTIIAVNDIYRLDGVAGGNRGGLARLRTLRTSIEHEGRRVVLSHGGDFLSPSLVSGVFKGKSMIDLMNRLDGDRDRFDEDMFVVFGNHEFDDSKCRDTGAVLDDRVAQSQFRWLNANLNFSDCNMLSTIPGMRNVGRNFLLNMGKVKVGLFGIGLTPDKMENIATTNYPKYEDEMVVATGNIEDLRRQGANFIIAITHLPRETDQKLLDELGAKGLDLILGGHDHDCMTLQAQGSLARGFKADSDAKTAWRIDLDFPSSGKPTMNSRLIKLDQSIPPDSDVADRAKEWTNWAEEAVCAKRKKPATCLNDLVGSTQLPIKLDEAVNRSQETDFGDWIADLVREKTGADIAIMNSGSFGLNDTIPAGSELKLRQIVDIFRFDDKVVTRPFPIKTVCEALEHGFSQPGRGAWPHVSGVNVGITEQNGARSVKVLGFTNNASWNCSSPGEIKVAALPFVLCGNDNYPFMPTIPAGSTCAKVLSDSAGPDNLLSAMAETAIRLAGTSGIKPPEKGRVRLGALSQKPAPSTCQ